MSADDRFRTFVWEESACTSDGTNVERLRGNARGGDQYSTDSLSTLRGLPNDYPRAAHADLRVVAPARGNLLLTTATQDAWHQPCSSGRMVRPALVAATAVSLLASATLAQAQTGANVLVVINTASAASEAVGREYAARRAVPQGNLCSIPMPIDKTVSRAVYTAAIERPVWKCISTQQAHDRILYIVLTKDVPMRVAGTDGRTGTASSVDSELTLLYRRRTGQNSPVMGFVQNPYFAAAAPIESLKPFTHESQDIYLVTRLDGNTVRDAVELINRGSVASPEGRFVLDGQGTTEAVPERWLSAAAQRLTSQGLGERVSRDGLSTGSQRPRVLGYYGWSWNQADRTLSPAGEFVPGALAGLFVSTSESLMADLVSAGLTGAAMNVDEPYLDATIRPDILFSAYASGRNLAESFYAAMPYLSWLTVIVGDPLCAPFPHPQLAQAEVDPPVDAATRLPAFFAPRVLATVMQNTSRDAATAFLRFQSRILSNDTAGARQDLQAAIAADPSFTAARTQLALLSDRAGDVELAIAQYRAILSFIPNDSFALNNLAYLLAISRRDPQQALPLAERAVLTARGDPAQLGMRILANHAMLGDDMPQLPLPSSLDTLAWVQHLLGRHTDAANTMREVRTTGGDSPEIRWHAAVIYASINDPARAASELRAAVAGDPTVVNRVEVQALRQQLGAGASFNPR